MDKKFLFLLAGVAVCVIVAGYLLVDTGSPQELADADNPAQVKRGKAIYANNCAECHGARLEGEKDWRRPLPEGGLPAPPHDQSGHT